LAAIQVVTSELIEVVPEIFSVDGLDIAQTILDKSFKAFDENPPYLSSLVLFQIFIM
jgi:hypothetical protein